MTETTEEYFDDEECLSILQANMPEDSFVAFLELLRRAVHAADRLRRLDAAAVSLPAEFDNSLLNPLKCLVWAAEDCSYSCHIALDGIIHEPDGSLSESFKATVAACAEPIKALPDFLGGPVLSGLYALEDLIPIILAVPAHEAAELFYSEDEGEFNPDALIVLHWLIRHL